jgi:hypothetical protein
VDSSIEQVPPLNSQKYKIQALIAEIDEVLSKPVPRLPWMGSIDTVHQRQLLERVRTYLVSTDAKIVAGNKPDRSQAVRREPVPVPKVPSLADRPSATEQIMLAVTAEINNLREGMMQPLQQDIETLRQEQQALVQEIKQLEATRQQQQSLAQQQANQQQIISEFLQTLTSRLQDTLVRDVSETLRSRETQLLQGSALPALGSSSDSQQDLNQQVLGEHPLLTPASRLEQMQLFQAHADSMLMRLDSTMSIVFEALQGNLQSYQESLSQGIEKMHGLGQQSEVMFAALVNHLAAELGREASSYVQSPIDLSNLESATPTAAVEPASTSPMLSKIAQTGSAAEARIPDAVARENRINSQLGEQERLPYAGTEISPQFGQLKRDRAQIGISLPDLEENLFGSEPLHDRPSTSFLESESAAESEVELAETGEAVEDLYASLFAKDEVAELELEDFTIENAETAVDSELVESQTPPATETIQSLNVSEDLFANLLDEEVSVENFLVGEDSDFVIANSVDELTLDTPDLFEQEVRSIPEISEPPASTFELQIDSDDREIAEVAPNSGEFVDTAVALQSGTLPPPPPPPVIQTGSEISSTRQAGQHREVSFRDVQTGDLSSEAQRLDDVYIQASPDEDLLPSDLLEDNTDRDINLDNNTFQLLEADLYSMEGLPNASLGRSPSSAAANSGLVNAPDRGAENPFAGAAEEELGSLEDLFGEVLELSSSDEPFSLEEELDAELFAEDEDSNVSLDEILESLIQTETTPVNAANQDS